MPERVKSKKEKKEKKLKKELASVDDKVEAETTPMDIDTSEEPSKSAKTEQSDKEAKKRSKKEKKKKEKKEKRKREEQDEGEDIKSDNSAGSSKKNKKQQKESNTDNNDNDNSNPAEQTTPAEARAFYEKEEIVVTGNGIEEFKPYLRFEQANFPSELKTGSGKTMAFALPSLVYLQKQHRTSEANNAGQHSSKKHKKQHGRNRSPRILVLAPTRELAMQTHEAYERGGTDLVRSVCIYGGVPKYEQRKALTNADVVVATPGRLQDLLDEVSFLVLDEADRMLDVGFEQAVRRILQHCRPTNERQTLMFSATWPDAVRRLADEFMRGPSDAAGGVVRVAIGNTDLAAILNDDRDKEFELQRLLKDYHRSRTNRILIFALYKKEAMRIEQNLARRGWAVQAIHGDKSQDQHYTFPLTIEDYVHRIGRTGRGGRKGIAHTLFTSTEKHLAGALQNVLRQANQEVPEALRKFGDTVKKKEHSSYGAFFRDVDTSVKATKIVFGDD
ncbi:P-loop containing nucleoside triphosphate hydrolase protein [Syncephalis plumigaleata]|nr:P-loop containing nucleoside triphosphate hydrolase protein [Syncephalis plumigaleata]